MVSSRTTTTTTTTTTTHTKHTHVPNHKSPAQVLDARNIEGTRCPFLERHLKKNASHKHLILVINKCDLIPAWAVKRWVQILSKEHPTLAFHASITTSFGKGSLINLLRQYAKLHQVITTTTSTTTTTTRLFFPPPTTTSSVL